jgi:hypothetical protein
MRAVALTSRVGAMIPVMPEEGGSAVASATAEQVLASESRQPARGLLRARTSRPWLHAVVSPFMLALLVVFATGIAAYVALGNGPEARYDFLGLTGHLGSVGNVLAAPVFHWDGVWYLALAEHGYQHAVDTAYYPLYPFLISLLAPIFGSAVIAAFAISIGCLLVALALLYRLTALELGEATARLTPYLLLLFPTALFLFAAYPESLFLCLEVGTVLAARRGRWALAGTLGGLAAATRNSGVLLVIPLLLLYLYGPRGEGGLLPRNRIRADALWIALVPIGLLAFVLRNLATFGDALASWHAEAYWHRGFAGPLSALWEGIAPALAAAGHLLGGHPSTGALQKLALLGVGLAAIVALIGVCRRLPPAYGAYSAAALVWSLSAPEQGHPLASSSRYVLTIFPLFMWLGSYLQRRRWIAAAVLALFALGLVYCSARFATWHWVA